MSFKNWNKLVFLNIIFLIMSLEVFADCKRADIQITNANPFLVNFNIAQTQPVSLTITHAPFTGSRRCVYAVVFNYGRANNFSNRRLENFSLDLLSFNVHKNLPVSNANILRDQIDVTNNNQILITPYFNPSGSTQSQIKTFYAQLPSIPINLNPGVYLDSLIAKVVARPVDDSTSGVQTWPVVAERALSFIYQKPAILDLSIVDTGQSFDSFDKSQLMSFGKLATGLTQSADVMIDTNVGYRLYLSSTNDGVLSHRIATDTIPYTMTLNGNLVNLAGSSLSPVNVINQPLTSPAGGYRLPIIVTVGTMTNTEQGGSYFDTLIFRAEAF